MAVSTVGAVATIATDLFSDITGPVRWLVLPLVSVLAVTVIVALLVWVGVGRGRHPFRAALPGALVIAVGWQGLQLGSAALVQRTLRETSSMNQTFGLVLGLLGVVYVASLLLVIGVQTNVVLHRHLWPRALLTPFTDSVALTEADRRAYTGYARAQRHKGFETVDVTFDEETDADRDVGDRT